MACKVSTQILLPLLLLSTTLLYSAIKYNLKITKASDSHMIYLSSCNETISQEQYIKLVSDKINFLSATERPLYPTINVKAKSMPFMIKESVEQITNTDVVMEPSIALKPSESIISATVIPRYMEKELSTSIPVTPTQAISLPEFVDFDVTFCSQGTLSRWGFMLEISKRWKGPMSIIYYFPIENLTYFNAIKDQTTLRDNINIEYFIQEIADVFPINFLRNQAINNVKTSHFWLADMDVWPTYGTYDAIRNIPKSFFADSKNVGIVPVYQNKRYHKCTSFDDCIDFYHNHLPETKRELHSCLKKHLCETFRPGENLHNYYFGMWYNETYDAPVTQLACFKTDTQEPYVIVRKTPEMPRFDERFKNYAFNKVQWIEHLRWTGYKFWVVTNAFAFDIPHPPSAYRKNFFKKMLSTNTFPMKKEYHKFLKEMKTNFTNKSVLPFCKPNRRSVVNL